MYGSVFFFDEQPHTADEWNQFTHAVDKEDEKYIMYTSFADDISLFEGIDSKVTDWFDGNLNNHKPYYFRSVEIYDDNNLKVSLSEPNKKNLHNFEAEALQKFANELKQSKEPSFETWRLVKDMIAEQTEDQFLHVQHRKKMGAFQLPDVIYINRNAHYIYHA